MTNRPSATAHVACLLATLCTTAPAWAQSPEPAIDTSAPRSTVAPAAIAPRPSAAPAPGAAPAPVAAPATPPPARRPSARAMDRVDLEASQITGNRELPRVLYIVPWRAPAAGELEGRPVNSLLFELTKPVDRDVFRRENRYFDALAPGAAATLPDVLPPAASPQASAESPPGAVR